MAVLIGEGQGGVKLPPVEIIHKHNKEFNGFNSLEEGNLENFLYPRSIHLNNRKW